MSADVNVEMEVLYLRAEIAGRKAEVARLARQREARNRREAVEELRDLGQSFGQIAKELGITRSGVQAILRPRAATGDDT
ncbi:MAG: hypothetical protein FWD59_03335 [Micrococcales bacterium]|nr:hypothetical protein [Micrococcales bacterium]